jgi:hypothetical protein
MTSNVSLQRARTLWEAHWPKSVALFVFALALWAQTDALVGVFYDDGIYVTLAKALAEGEGYRSIHLPGAPAAVHYPPLYPAALALLWRAWPDFPANIVLFQLFDALVFGAAAWVIALHARRALLPGSVAVPALVLGFSAFPLLAMVGVRFSEPLFLFLVAGALLTADGEHPKLRRAGLAGLLAGLATLTRSIGLAAVVGIAVALWVRGAKKSAVTAFLVSTVVLLPWVVWLGVHGGDIDPRIAANYGTYGQFAGQAGLRGVLQGLDLRALAPLGRLLFPAWPWPLTAVLKVVFGLTLVVGGVTLVRRAPALVVSLVPYFAIVTLWPYTPDRFVWILLPWLGLLSAAAAVHAWRWGWRARVVLLALAVVLVVGYGPREVRSLSRRGFARTAERTSEPFRLLTAAISAGTLAEAVVATDGEALVYLYTDRHSVPLELYRLRGRDFESLSAEVTAAFFCEQGVTHIAASVPEPLPENLAAAGERTIVPLFRVTNGPSLFEFRCSP